MVLLSFSVAKEDVRNGIKGISIRAERKRPFRLGDPLHIYWKSRTKECEKLRQDVCLFEKRILWKDISNLKHRNDLAQIDGFLDWAEMKKWFYNAHKDLNPNKKMQIVGWIQKEADKVIKVFEMQKPKGAE